MFLVYIVLCLVGFGCQYQCNWLPGKTHLWNDILCVEWDVKPYTLTHSLMFFILIAWLKCVILQYFQNFCNLRTEMQSLILSVVLKVKSLFLARSPAWSLCLLFTSYVCSYRTSVLTEWSVDALSQSTDVELFAWNSSFWSVMAVCLCDTTTVWQTGFVLSAACWVLLILTMTVPLFYYEVLCVIFWLSSIKSPDNLSLKYCTS